MRNGKVVVYNSPRLKALIAALPDRQPTLTGSGSVAHTQDVPSSISVTSCTLHGPTVDGNSTVRVRVKTWPFKACYTVTLGHGLLYCKKCCSYAIEPGERLWYPEAKENPIGVKYYEGTMGANGNAMTGEKY